MQHQLKWHFSLHILLPFQTNQPDPPCGTAAPLLLPCVCTAGSGLGWGGCVGVSWVLGRGEKGSQATGPQHPAGSALPGCNEAPWASSLSCCRVFPQLRWSEGGSPGRAAPSRCLQSRPPSSGAQKPRGAMLTFFTCPDWCRLPCHHPA